MTEKNQVHSAKLFTYQELKYWVGLSSTSCQQAAWPTKKKSVNLINLLSLRVQVAGKVLQESLCQRTY